MNILPKELSDIQEQEDGAKRKRSFKVLDPLWLVLKNGTLLILLTTQVSMCGRLNKLQKQEAPTLIQMADGSGLAVQPEDASYRSPAVVKAFLNEWLPLFFNWDSEIVEGSTKKRDAGQPINGAKIPTETSYASAVLDDPLRLALLKTLITDKSYDLSSYLRTDKSRVMIPSYIGEPKKLEDGNLSVKVVATWRVFSTNDKAGVDYPYNKEFILAPVNKPVSPLGANASVYEQAVYSVFSKGLKIVEIRDLIVQ